ncbi:MAG: rubredoxin [Heliobacteriaceae bacterium]|jgi:rubredoxin|nr:rubredoxin [Heliobacteriaceae bacterium]
MEKYICTVCGHVYDPEQENNVSFESLSDDWVCPVCGVGKDMFTQE